MTDPQHKGGWTPGPWEFGHGTNRPYGVDLNGYDGIEVGSLPDARLIAAAPELYEALLLCAPYAAQAESRDMDNVALDAVIKARAALAKASPDKSGGA